MEKFQFHFGTRINKLLTDRSARSVKKEEIRIALRFLSFSNWMDDVANYRDREDLEWEECMGQAESRVHLLTF